MVDSRNSTEGCILLAKRKSIYSNSFLFAPFNVLAASLSDNLLASVSRDYFLGDEEDDVVFMANATRTAAELRHTRSTTSDVRLMSPPIGEDKEFWQIPESYDHKRSAGVQCIREAFECHGCGKVSPLMR
jgi:hypothetical protein